MWPLSLGQNFKPQLQRKSTMGQMSSVPEEYPFLSRRIRYDRNSSPKRGKYSLSLCPNVCPVCTMRTIVRIASIRRRLRSEPREPGLSEIAPNPLNPRIFLFPLPFGRLAARTATSPHGGVDEARFLALPRTARVAATVAAARV